MYGNFGNTLDRPIQELKSTSKLTRFKELLSTKSKSKWKSRLSGKTKQESLPNSAPSSPQPMPTVTIRVSTATLTDIEI